MSPCTRLGLAKIFQILPRFFSKFYPCLIRPNADWNNHQENVLCNFSKVGFFLTWQFSVDLGTLTASEVPGNTFFLFTALILCPRNPRFTF